MKRLVAGVVAGMVWGHVACAQDDVIGFKAARLGASVAEFQAAFPDFECKPSGPCVFDRERHCVRKTAGPIDGAACQTRNTWAGVNVVRVFASFETGVLKRVLITFRPSDLDQIVLAARERWGAPVSDETSEIQNRMGARFTNRELRWERGGVSLMVRRYGRQVDEGSAFIVSRADVEDSARRRLEVGKDAAKDL